MRDIEFFQGIDGRLIIAGAVLRCRFPGGVIEPLSRSLIIPGIHRPLSTLILAQPQALPVQRVNRVRRGKQHCRQHKDIAAAEQQGSQGKQAQYQPRPLFAPDIRRSPGTGLLSVGLDGGEIAGQQPDVLVVFCQAHIHAAACCSKPAQCTLIQYGDYDLTVFPLQETAVRQ